MTDQPAASAPATAQPTVALSWPLIFVLVFLLMGWVYLAIGFVGVIESQRSQADRDAILARSEAVAKADRVEITRAILKHNGQMTVFAKSIQSSLRRIEAKLQTTPPTPAPPDAPTTEE